MTRECLSAECDFRQVVSIDGGDLTVFYDSKGEWVFLDTGPRFWEISVSVIGCVFDRLDGESVVMTEPQAVAAFGRDVLDNAEELAMEGLE